MRILGVNLGATKGGKKLKDGGACVIESGEVQVAIAEERVSRVKSRGGYQLSLGYVLDYLGEPIESFDAVVVSTCCEELLVPGEVNDPMLRKARRLLTLGHHESHAYSAFFASGFDRALIIVMDAGGNTLVPCNGIGWWRYPREQNSYFVGEGTTIKLIDRDFDSPYEVGFGEVYRAFTYYLGWPSYVHSGKTMALAAYADEEVIRDSFLFIMDSSGHIRSKLRADPLNPIKMVRNFAQEYRVVIPPARCPGDPITQEHMNLAGVVQSSLEKALLEKIRMLTKKTGITDVCLAGGVALNCVLNGKILNETSVRRLFIQPAAGDQGQCLGNAYYGLLQLSGERIRNIKPFDPFLGRPYATLEFTPSSNGWQPLDTGQPLKLVAQLLADGKLVGWFNGQSEFGPRALGNRSILADPRRLESKYRLLGVKGREWFMPFAPSILWEYQSEFFELDRESPYMSLASPVKPSKRRLVPAIVHQDGTSRPQTVTANTNPIFYQLLVEFHKVTGIPLLLNTSFNRKGEPIVETPQDAWEMFLNSDIDYLFTNGKLFAKRESMPEISRLLAGTFQAVRSVQREAT